MPLCRIVYGLKQGTRPVKMKLTYLLLYQNVMFNRTYSSGGVFHLRKEERVSPKFIDSAFNSVISGSLRYEKDVYSELLEELELDKFLGSEVKCFFTKDISQFKILGIELKREKIAEKLVKYLAPFNLDMTPIYYYPKAKRLRISLKTIIGLVEMQYLAYRLNIEIKVMCTYFKEMKNCFFHYKSMRSIKRNLDAILSDKKLKHMGASNIIFFLNNLRPFNVTNLREIENNLIGISWDRTPIVCPALVKHSYHGIMFRINMMRAVVVNLLSGQMSITFMKCHTQGNNILKILKFVALSKDMGFTDEQIRFGLPYLGILVPNLFRNVHWMLSEFGSYKNDEFFLRLLGACFCQQRGLFGMVWKSYEAIQKAVLLKEQKRESLIKSKRMICVLQERLGMTKKEWKILKNHPAVIVETRALDTLNLLLERGFTKEEILESITVILYPKYLIEKNLEKVAKEEDNLRKLGFENGCLRRASKYFANGTMLRQKTLQLCLYYLEKSIYVSEDTVLDFDKLNEELSTNLTTAQDK